jgi:predicted phage terminase large subunit-like protein
VPGSCKPFWRSRRQHSLPACIERSAGAAPRRSAIWRPIGWAEEQGQIRGAIGPHLDRRIRELATFITRTPFPARGDKSVRAQSIRGGMALDGLYVPAVAAWLADFRAELLSFPAGRHDDQVDAIGLIGQLLDKMVRPAKVKPVQRPVRDLWDRDDTLGRGWTGRRSNSRAHQADEGRTGAQQKLCVSYIRARQRDIMPCT